MKLWVDDERPAPEGWVRVTTAGEAKHYIRTGIVKELSLDHDLGPPTAGTGYDVITWLEERVAEVPDFVPPEVITVHSANPVGRTRMLQVVESIRRIQQQRIGGG